MPLVRELIRTDAENLESEVSNRIEKVSGSVTLFIVDMREISNILARAEQAQSSRFLNLAGKLLLEVCEEHDRIYRIGDNTFGILLTGIESIAHQKMAAEKISRLQNDAIREMGASFNSSIRMGIASYPEDANNALELIHKARIALESAQSLGQNYVIYSKNSASDVSTKWNLQEELAAAIHENQFQLHYQPKVDTKTGRPIGAEALLRWTNEEGVAVSPDIFIPVACDIRLINELTRYVLTTALVESAQWPDIGYRYNLSVNMEANTVYETDIKNIVSSSLSIFGSDNCDLTLEITETTLAVASKQNFQCLNELRAMDVGISIDDFGTGYSSFSYFRDIPATELKIDKSFIDKILDSDRDRNLVETIVMLAHRFDLLVVAEGVETADQLETLRQMNCDYVQGHYVSKALPNNEIRDWFAKHRD
jgi:EAL domain-containing protein (putative c-di-GMP-specific phosphodiesterase class I)/GGDEF domain-containing protein